MSGARGQERGEVYLWGRVPISSGVAWVGYECRETDEGVTMMDISEPGRSGLTNGRTTESFNTRICVRDEIVGSLAQRARFHK